MNEKKRNFDQAAKTWDSNERRQRLADGVFCAINDNVPIDKNMRALDFGCGTGLVSLKIQPLVREIVCADSSMGMLEVLQSKIRASDLDNISTLYLPEGELSVISGNYDLIFSSMTLHHINNLEELFLKFGELLAENGYLCLADLDSDDGLFHEDNSGVYHNGFDRSELISLLKKCGFKYLRDLTAVEIEKEIQSGIKRKFTIFLIICRK
ncbi:MAG TPA: class I SAM-dependent methyltransferase [Spirochaetota bacterium]|jgi:ubiquinone/menaquinone biosynthesis C-methylase UbiE|nr:class I SAM-dependent methyltransferase [Spirochaetota bacterium]HOK93600.1 class I SAM-dependent methyltransferase [Spirochaetota bacterium]HON17245.1 class I SAM-dependent methyltransferase [Spirochaetota bacterium]HOV08445.1 class I SAM-dependent methyltransferase [Spirochaetota bacterium]HPD79149.1 class I SAM-dependent methyltransferase [Spirochaetota bacterium]